MTEISGIHKHNKALALLGLGFAVLFWAINTVIAKGVIAQINPMALSFFRWLAALIFIFPFAFNQLNREFIPIRQNIGFIFVLSILSVAVYNSVLYMGAQYTTATNISLVVAAMPAMTLGFAWMINRQRPKRLQTLGILVSLAGVMVIISKGSFALFVSFRFNPGDLLVVASIASWALYSVLLKKKSIPISPISFLTMTIIFGTLIIFPFYVWEYFCYQGFEVTLPIVWMFVYLGICPSILSYICWNHGVKTIGSETASVFMYLIPVFTCVIAYVFLGERLFAYHLTGGLLVFCGLILSSRQ
jgi:drug/metabolite transporter (DMT)-like permease